MDSRTTKPFPILIKNNRGRYTICFCHPELFLDEPPNENTQSQHLNFKRRRVDTGNTRFKRIQFETQSHPFDAIDALCYGFDGYSKLISDHIDTMVRQQHREVEKIMSETNKIPRICTPSQITEYINFENVVKFESAADNNDSCVLTMKDGSKIELNRNFWDVFEYMLKDVRKRSGGEKLNELPAQTCYQNNKVETVKDDNTPTNKSRVSDTQKSPEVKKRISKINYYLDIAEVVASRGTCLRRNYGSVIVKDDRIVSTGYTGAPRGRKNCSDIGSCIRQKQNIPRGERYELCRSVHSEMNAIINASKDDMKGATLYLVGKEFPSGELVDQPNCCAMCKRAVINAGITRVIVRNSDRSFKTIIVADWVDDDDSLKMERGY